MTSLKKETWMFIRVKKIHTIILKDTEYMMKGSKCNDHAGDLAVRPYQKEIQEKMYLM